ncbi:hypothetical protein [Isoptericola sp. BMS4]|uniref:hypothetical protein n=1 Tax=Isoptericola sp. BMS4 TaxID=2527875 RepID=UPI0014244B12|nr:hypothetical protein [Isoptericola sp. BMS4]
MTITLCVLLWARPGAEDLLTEYESHVLALVPRHGGRVVSRVRADSPAGDLPTEVQVIQMPGEDALAAYMADPERAARLDVRDRAIARTEIVRGTPVA